MLIGSCSAETLAAEDHLMAPTTIIAARSSSTRFEFFFLAGVMVLDVHFEVVRELL
jgi:hypothetical protein